MPSSKRVKVRVNQGAVLLKEFRDKKKMTAEALAEKLGCDKYMICRYERGVHVPQGRRAILLRDVCKIPVESWFL